MADEEGALMQDVINKTLQEVRATAATRKDELDPCVICLESISEKAIAYPCKHENFDFLCLISWLQEKDTCPLCKAVVKNVNYDLQSRSGPKRYAHSSITKETRLSRVSPRGRGQGRARARGHEYGARYEQRQRVHTGQPTDDALARRRRVYTNKMYSLHVGTNRVSQYQDLTPQSFTNNDRLQARAKTWIRRELLVFDFLNPDSANYGSASTQRRANNAEFLLEYIVAILKTVDIKGSRGQAEELISEFLGKENTSLFLHELQAWLRSPYERLEDWDRAVQYDNPLLNRADIR